MTKNKTKLYAKALAEVILKGHLDEKKIIDLIVDKHATVMLCGSIDMGKTISNILNEILSKRDYSIEKMGKNYQQELWG